MQGVSGPLSPLCLIATSFRRCLSVLKKSFPRGTHARLKAWPFPVCLLESWTGCHGSATVLKRSHCMQNYGKCLVCSHRPAGNLKHCFLGGACNVRSRPDQKQAPVTPVRLCVQVRPEAFSCAYLRLAAGTVPQSRINSVILIESFRFSARIHR
jgi:hypothetical protein